MSDAPSNQVGENLVVMRETPRIEKIIHHVMKKYHPYVEPYKNTFMFVFVRLLTALSLCASRTHGFLVLGAATQSVILRNCDHSVVWYGCSAGVFNLLRHTMLCAPTVCMSILCRLIFPPSGFKTFVLFHFILSPNWYLFNSTIFVSRNRPYFMSQLTEEK